MRDIKFRAWLKNEHKMVEVKEFSWIFNNITYYNGSTGMEATFDEIELMQYTGLKDKNGTRIYEGDIIEAVYRIETFNNEIILDLTGRVRYFETCYYLINEEDSVMLSDLENIEIIGNVYDNPELSEG